MNENITREEIKENVNLWVNANLRRFTFRQYQLEYIIEILYSILHDNNQLNLVEAPTGSGKSIMVIIMAGVLSAYYQKKSYILCSDLYLWEQYANAIDGYRLKNFGKIKGTIGNYKCSETEEDFSTAPCRLAMIPYANLANKDWCIKHKWTCGLFCKYIKERFRAIISEVTVMPYQLWLIYMNDFIADEGTSEKSFTPRHVIFCDECHKVPTICQEYRQIDIELHKDLNNAHELLSFCKEINLCLDQAEFLKNFDINLYLEDLEETIRNIYQIPKENQEELAMAILKYREVLSKEPVMCYNAFVTLYEKLSKEDNEHTAHLSKKEQHAFNLAKEFARKVNVIDEYFRLQVLPAQDKKYRPERDPEFFKYIVKSDNREYDSSTGKLVWPDNPVATYKFAKEDALVYNTLLKHQPYTVMMSATIGGHAAFDDNIGTKYIEGKKSKMFTIPSTFDFSKSPIYYIPGNKMSREYIGKSFETNSEIINKILKSPKHAHEKGIIHTGSYKNAWDLKNKLDPEVQKRIFIYNTSKEKKDILEKFKLSDNGVLIGPTLTDGIDLPDDGCRFIIIFKIPYPYLGDELVKAKISLFPKWYNSESSKSIIQGIGRGNRTPTDWSTTYILDGCFAKLYEETREQYAPEFRERIKLLNS